MTHICVSKLIIIGSDNGLSPDRRQAIIWTNAGLFLIGPLGTNFSEILIEILTFSFKKMHLKVSSAKRRPFCLGLNVLSTTKHNTKKRERCYSWYTLWNNPSHDAHIPDKQRCVATGLELQCNEFPEMDKCPPIAEGKMKNIPKKITRKIFAERVKRAYEKIIVRKSSSQHDRTPMPRVDHSRCDRMSQDDFDSSTQVGHDDTFRETLSREVFGELVSRSGDGLKDSFIEKDHEMVMRGEGDLPTEGRGPSYQHHISRDFVNGKPTMRELPESANSPSASPEQTFSQLISCNYRKRKLHDHDALQNENTSPKELRESYNLLNDSTSSCKVTSPCKKSDVVFPHQEQDISQEETCNGYEHQEKSNSADKESTMLDGTKEAASNTRHPRDTIQHSNADTEQLTYADAIIRFPCDYPEKKKGGFTFPDDKPSDTASDFIPYSPYENFKSGDNHDINLTHPVPLICTGSLATDQPHCSKYIEHTRTPLTIDAERAMALSASMAHGVLVWNDKLACGNERYPDFIPRISRHDSTPTIVQNACQILPPSAETFLRQATSKQPESLVEAWHLGQNFLNAHSFPEIMTGCHLGTSEMLSTNNLYQNVSHFITKDSLETESSDRNLNQNQIHRMKSNGVVNLSNRIRQAYLKMRGNFPSWVPAL